MTGSVSRCAGRRRVAPLTRNGLARRVKKRSFISFP